MTVPVSEWPLVPISALYEGLYDGPHATPKPADEGPVFLGIKNVTDDGRLDLREIRHISEDDYGQWTRRVEPRSGDLVFTYEATLNRYAIIPDGFRGCLGRRMALIRPNLARVDVRYLHFYFFSPEWRSVVTRHTLKGATVDRLPLTHFPEFPVRAPPLPVQKEIAAILSAYDDLIDNCERRIRVLDEMARALYLEWFVKFRYPGHEKGSFVDSPLGKLPRGWNVRALGEVASLTMGLSPKGDTYNEAGDGTPLVNGPVEFGRRLTKRVKWTTSPTKLCAEGDLVVCVRGSTTGKFVKSDGVYCLGRGVCSLRSKQQSFVDQLFQNELPRLLGQTSGSTFPSWTGPQLQKYPVVAPPIDLVETFERIVQPMTSVLLFSFREIENLQNTRDLLLPRLLSGQLSVADLAA